MKVLRRLAAVVLLAATGALLLVLVLSSEGGPGNAGYLVEHGPAETGALNLVTAIYLGYRAFDTLGETVVLVLAVVGVSVLFVRKR